MGDNVIDKLGVDSTLWNHERGERLSEGWRESLVPMIMKLQGKSQIRREKRGREWQVRGKKVRLVGRWGEVRKARPGKPIKCKVIRAT